MGPAETLYPLALGAGNLGAGWLLYALLDLRLGAPVVVLGALVLVTMCSRTLRRVRPSLAVRN